MPSRSSAPATSRSTSTPRRSSVAGKPVHLTGKEYQMLELLSLRKGTTLTKEMFLNHLYGGMDEPELKIIDVFICKLRKKLAQATGGENYIETVWGRGYVLRNPEPGHDGSADRRRRLTAAGSRPGGSRCRPRRSAHWTDWTLTGSPPITSGGDHGRQRHGRDSRSRSLTEARSAGPNWPGLRR